MRIVELRYVVEILYVGGFGDRSSDRAAFGVRKWKRAFRNATKHGGDKYGRFEDRDAAERFAESGDVCLGWGIYNITEIEINPTENHQ